MKIDSSVAIYVNLFLLGAEPVLFHLRGKICSYGGMHFNLTGNAIVATVF